MSEIRALLLAAGKGTRLKPLTNDWPKCLMPIGDRPLLEYWLQTLHQVGIKKILVNLHHHSEKVEEFLQRPRFKDRVDSVFEEKLLGATGTFLANRNYFQNCTTLLIHADNWCQCNFDNFLSFHMYRRPLGTNITMMTFFTDSPQSCGIVKCDGQGVVQEFYEKCNNPTSNLANAAVYLLDSSVLQWLEKQTKVHDFSTQVLPKFLGKIATWHNDFVHKDIGTINSLQIAQYDLKPKPLWPKGDDWQKDFLENPIHRFLHKK